MDGSNSNISIKTLQDILDRNVLECRAVIHWAELSADKKKKKGYKYNQVLKNNWGVKNDIQWPNDYFLLGEFQKRLLLKKELINAYNNLEQEDKKLVNKYLSIKESCDKWICLTSEEKKRLLKEIFNFF